MIDIGCDHALFESLVLFSSALAFFTSVIDKIKTKRGAIFSLMLIGLFLYGYPYSSWFYGFSYLTVGISMTALILTITEMLFAE